MTLVRQHHYTVDPADLPEHLARRAKAIDAIRAGQPGLVQTRLTRLEDGTFTDAWYWDTAEHMGAAFAASREIPEVGPAMALVRDNSTQNGEVVDERSGCAILTLDPSIGASEPRVAHFGGGSAAGGVLAETSG